MPAYRTPVRYKGSCGVCVRIVDVPVRGNSAPILRVIFSHGGEGREFLRVSPGLFNIWRRRFILLAAYPSPPTPTVVRSSFPLVSFPYACPSCVSFVRLARRLVMSSRRASRLVRFVASCRSSCRLTCSSRRLVIRRPDGRLVSRRSVLLFACSHSVCRGGFALCSHSVSFSPWRIVHHLVGSSRSFPVISFRLTRVRLVPVIMPCFRVRAVQFCCSLVLVRLFSPGLCPRSWGGTVRHGHGAAVLALLISSVPSWLLLATHSLRDGGGRMWDMGRCSVLLAARSLACSCPIVLLITSDSHRPNCVLSSPHPRSKKAGGGGDGGEVG